MNETGKTEQVNAYEDGRYGSITDPYDFAESPYEAMKYQHQMYALGGRHYQRALEIGCANGVLTDKLSRTADEVIAIDAHEVPVDAARERNAANFNVEVMQGEVPYFWPDYTFDLIVASDMMYYLTGKELVDLGAKIESSLSPGGDLLVLNYDTGDAELDECKIYHLFFEKWTDLSPAGWFDAGALDNRSGRRHAFLLSKYTKKPDRT